MRNLTTDFLRRADDNAKTAPTLPYYKARGPLRGVDGMAGLDQVTAALPTILSGILPIGSSWRH